MLRSYLGQTGVKCNLFFPVPPLAGKGVVVPITDSNSLFQEGIDQNNCVYSYLPEILIGKYYVYQVKGPERATLGIAINRNSTVQLDQLLTASNTRVSSQTDAIVACWLNPTRLGSQLHVAEHKQKRFDECMTAYMEYQAFRGS